MAELLADLAERGVRRLMVEGGGNDAHPIPRREPRRRTPRSPSRRSSSATGARRVSSATRRSRGPATVAPRSPRYGRSATSCSCVMPCPTGSSTTPRRCRRARGRPLRPGRIVRPTRTRTAWTTIATILSAITLFVVSLAPGLIRSGSALALVRIPLESDPRSGGPGVPAVAMGAGARSRSPSGRFFVLATISAALDRELHGDHRPDLRRGDGLAGTGGWVRRGPRLHRSVRGGRHPGAGGRCGGRAHHRCRGVAASPRRHRPAPPQRPR